MDILKRIVRKLERKQRNKGAVLKEPFFLTAVEPLAWSFTFPILRSAFRTLSKSRIHSSGQGYTLLSVVSGGTKAAFSCSKNATKMQQNAAKMQQNATVRLSEWWVSKVGESSPGESGTLIRQSRSGVICHFLLDSTLGERTNPTPACLE